VLPAQSLAEKQVSSFPLDLATLVDVAHLVVARIFGLREVLGVRTAGGLVELARSPLAERLMGSLLVVLTAEVIETVLLGEPSVAGGRAVSALRMRCICSCRPFCSG
jgi:hypothetical protein